MTVTSTAESKSNYQAQLNYRVFVTDGRREIPLTDEDRTPVKVCQFLEEGGIIFLPQSPFKRSTLDTEFLLQLKQEGSSYRKNIAYHPNKDSVTGVKTLTAKGSATLCNIMREFSLQAQDLVRSLLSPYAGHWKIDMASYRPIEEKARKMRLRARNDLLHVDSFSTRLTYGNRIMRVFENINPSKSRIWQTSDPFARLAETFQPQMAPPQATPLAALENFPLWRIPAKILGFRLNASSPYDRWMLNFHNFLKENTQFQTTCRKDRWEFPHGSAWICFTDTVSHSVLSGQYALEQTFIISQQDLVAPEIAPINILRRLYPTAKL